MDSHSIGSVTLVTTAPQSTPRGVPAQGENPRPAGNEITAAVDPAARQQEPVVPLRDPRSLRFHVDGDRVITTIVDENSNTVVMQIPDAEVIRIAKAIDRMQGFLVEQKA